MTIEVRRFGVGHRRPGGPPGTVAVSGAVIHSDARGTVSELAFAANASIAPHDSPNTTWFVVIEGGGWVAVGDERRRVAAGEAVLWPPHVIHGAWTEHGHMRAIVVELAAEDDAVAPPVLPGAATPLEPGRRGDADRGGAERGEGALAPRVEDPATHDRTQGEPI